MKKLISLIIVSVGLGAVVAHTTTSTASESREENVHQLATRNERVVLHIPKIRSRACPVLVKAALAKLDGIETFSANVEEKTVTIHYDAARLSVEEIQNAIRVETGFDSEVVR